MLRAICFCLFFIFSGTTFANTLRTPSEIFDDNDFDTTVEIFPKKIKSGENRLLHKGTWEDFSTLRHRIRQRRLRNLKNRRQRLNRKCMFMLEKTACSWIDEAMYKNEKGSVILDAKLCKKILDQDIFATCLTCYKTFKFSEIYEHYKKSNHRFFYDVRHQND